VIQRVVAYSYAPKNLIARLSRAASLRRGGSGGLLTQSSVRVESCVENEYAAAEEQREM
jgi:hypothetical protein